MNILYFSFCQYSPILQNCNHTTFKIIWGQLITIVSLLFDPLQLQNIFDRCRDELMKAGAVHDVRSMMKNLKTDRNKKSHLWRVFNLLSDRVNSGITSYQTTSCIFHRMLMNSANDLRLHRVNGNQSCL